MYVGSFSSSMRLSCILEGMNTNLRLYPLPTSRSHTFMPCGQGSTYLAFSHCCPTPPGFPVSINCVGRPWALLRTPWSRSMGRGSGNVPASSTQASEMFWPWYLSASFTPSRGRKRSRAPFGKRHCLRCSFHCAPTLL